MSKAKAKKDDEQYMPLTVYYEDATNFYDIAALLVDKAQNSLATSDLPPETFGDIDLDFMSKALPECFDVPVLMQLMETDFGQGLLFGIYLNEKANLDNAAFEESSDI